MKAELLLRERLVLTVSSFVDLVVWKVPKPLVGSKHRYKYRLAYIVNNVCVLRFDNEVGKGDHKHLDDVEVPYKFIDLQQLRTDFFAEVRSRSKQK